MTCADFLNWLNLISIRRRSPFFKGSLAIVLLTGGVLAAQDNVPVGADNFLPKPATGSGDDLSLPSGSRGATPSSEGQNTTENSADLPPNYDPTPQDAIDGSAPFDQDATKFLRNLEGMIRQQRWERAQEGLLVLLDQKRNALVRLADGRLSPVTTEVNRLLARFPDDQLDFYRQRYGGVALQELEGARNAGGLAKLRRVIDQFPQTEAAGAAVVDLAKRHYDRGEFGLAADYFQRLLDSRANLNSLPEKLRLQLGATFLRQGDEETATRVFAGLPQDMVQNSSAAQATPGDWANAQPSITVDWRLPFGSADGQAVSAATDPLFLARWSNPRIRRSDLRERVDRLSSELVDASRALIPAAMPLLIGERAIYRTLNGVAVVDVHSGRLLWETPGPQEPDRTGLESVQEVQQVLARQQAFGPVPSNIGPAERDPLTDLLFRDAIWGMISADDRHLYVVEELPQSVAENNREPIGAQGEESGASFNRVMAYELESGRPAWPGRGVGGLPSGDRFDPPLAGYFFFGPPVVAYGELYLIGQFQKEIHLVALDPDSGSPRWTRLIAYAQTDVGQDTVRRQWLAQPSLASGIIVCPTTTGWLVALDVASKNFLWAYRYSPLQERTNGRSEQPSLAMRLPLNQRWEAAIPVIVGNQVVFTPPEDSRMVCLDLLRGDLKWQRGRASDLYVAGAVGNLLVTVGAGSLHATQVDTGRVVWSQTVGGGTRKVSGRALLTPNRCFLPLHGDKLLEFDLKTGSPLGQRELPAGSPPLGNLVYRPGTLLSLGPNWVTAYEDRAALVASLDEKGEAKSDPALQLRRAAMQRAEGDLAAAADTLGAIDSVQLPDSLQSAVRKLRVAVVTAMVTQEPAEADASLEVLEEIADSASRRTLLPRLRAEHLHATGNLAGAAAVYFELADRIVANDLSPEDRVVKELDRMVQLEVWVSGRLSDSWQQAPEELREMFEREITARLSLAKSEGQLEQFTRLFWFHPQAAAAAVRLAESRMVNEPGSAELTLLRASRHSDAIVAKAALDALINLAESAGLEEDAASLRLARAAQTQRPNEDDETGEPLNRPTFGPPDWGYHQLEITRTSGYYGGSSSRELPLPGVPLPSLETQIHRLETGDDRLTITDDRSGELLQSIPLQIQPTVAGSGLPPLLADGHILFISHRGRVQAVASRTGQVLWSQPAAGGSVGSVSMSGGSLRPVNQVAAAHRLQLRNQQQHGLLAANADYVALLDRRELRVLDAASGEERWRMDDLSTGNTVVGVTDSLYLFENDRATQRIRPLDGRSFALPENSIRLSQVIGSVENDLLSLRSEQVLSLFGFQIGRAVLSLTDPQTGQDRWSQQFDPDSLFDVLSDGSVCVLTSQGEFLRVVPETGQQTTLGRVPANLVSRKKDASVLVDGGMAYLAINTGNHNATFYSSEVPSIAVSGELLAFDLGGGLRWQRSVQNQRLLSHIFDHLPVLLFSSSRMVKKGEMQLWQVDLLALDKTSGRAVFDEPFYTSYGPYFRGLSIDPREKVIELTSFNQRIRLQHQPLVRPPIEAPRR